MSNNRNAQTVFTHTKKSVIGTCPKNTQLPKPITSALEHKLYKTVKYSRALEVQGESKVFSLHFVEPRSNEFQSRIGN